ncbi:DeoR family transcriptional regulator [Bifidobacterium simiarum]|uniref:DeoR family transcriptional regulator n=1 Tax=Bifidobacterium simiarum TaxID=2045441 RepID=UPI001BDCCCF0|nr:DeoR family transcriptional regulator [Bifidobacterium simiarum]MBT1165527.1 DeoR family transcriptional regulator [Bifidobacterium simiarum]
MSCKINFDHTRELIHARNPSHPWLDLDNASMLRAAKLYGRNPETGERGLTLAAVMLLGTDDAISDVCPAYKTDAIVRRQNIDRYDSRLIVTTNLIDAYDRLLVFAQNHLPNPFVLEHDVSVNTRAIICRELISNMLIHREFTNPYIAKMIIDSSGIRTENASRTLFEGKISLDDFNPMPKNPIIADFFMQIGRADELGSGTHNLYKYSRLYSGKEPELIDGDIFKAFVPTPAISDTPETAPAQTGRQSAAAKRTLTILDAIDSLLNQQGYATSSQVAELVGVTSRTAQRHLVKLVEAGVLQIQGTSNRNRRYVKP